VSRNSNVESIPESGEPSRRERKALERRLAILRAAAGVFRDRGYEGASMDEIAERLDMAKGNLYYYFKNKQELLFFCQDHSLDRLIEAAREIESLAAREDEKLRRLVVEHVVCVLDELDGASAHTEFHVLPDELRARLLAKRDAYESRVRALVAAGIKTGVFASVDAKMATLALLGALNAAPRWYRPGGPRSAEAIGEQFAALFLDGLRDHTSKSQTPRRTP
jgi:AcrR family transcriptional regulator